MIKRTGKSTFLRAGKLETQVGFLYYGYENRILSFSVNLNFLLLRLSTDWIRPIHMTGFSAFLKVYDYTSFSSVQSLSRVQLFTTPWIAAHQASLSINNSQSSLRLTSIESMMPSSHLILCRPLLLLPPIPPSTLATSCEELTHWKRLWCWEGLREREEQERKENLTLAIYFFCLGTPSLPACSSLSTFQARILEWVGISF